MSWYVIVTKPLQEFIALENLQNQNYKVFLPTCQVEKKRGSTLKLQTEPLFRRYLFIELDQIKSNWYPIRSTKGVGTLLRFGVEPFEVNEKIVQEIQELTQNFPVIQELFKKGEEIQIKEGPFRGLKGVFDKLISEASGEVRALILLEIFGKQTQIVMQLNQI